MFFVYFNIQVTFFYEHATPYEYIGLPEYKILNLLFTLGQLQTLFILDPVANFSVDIFKRTIGIIRVLDNK